MCTDVHGSGVLPVLSAHDNMTSFVYPKIWKASCGRKISTTVWERLPSVIILCVVCTGEREEPTGAGPGRGGGGKGHHAGQHEQG